MSILVSFKVKDYEIRNDSDLYFTCVNFFFPQKVWDISLHLWLSCIHMCLGNERLGQQIRGQWERSCRILFSPCKVILCCCMTTSKAKTTVKEGCSWWVMGFCRCSLSLGGSTDVCMCIYTYIICILCVLYFFLF